MRGRKAEHAGTVLASVCAAATSSESESFAITGQVREVFLSLAISYCADTVSNKEISRESCTALNAFAETLEGEKCGAFVATAEDGRHRRASHALSSDFLSTKQGGGPDDCFFAIYKASSCGKGAVGGVYQITPAWFTGHYGGTYASTTNGCGSVIENWQDVGYGSHESYLGFLGKDIEVSGKVVAIYQGPFANSDCSSTEDAEEEETDEVTPPVPTTTPVDTGRAVDESDSLACSDLEEKFLAIVTSATFRVTPGVISVNPDNTIDVNPTVDASIDDVVVPAGSGKNIKNHAHAAFWTLFGT